MSFDYGEANKEQRFAIETTEGPLLIIAGPGTAGIGILITFGFLIGENCG